MNTFISVTPDVKGKTQAQLTEYLYLIARSAGYARNEALETMEKCLKEWTAERESCWERTARTQAARNEELRILLLNLREKITAALLKDGA